jgi:hypothetical protein
MYVCIYVCMSGDTEALALALPEALALTRTRSACARHVEVDYVRVPSFHIWKQRAREREGGREGGRGGGGGGGREIQREIQRERERERERDTYIRIRTYTYIDRQIGRNRQT